MDFISQLPIPSFFESFLVTTTQDPYQSSILHSPVFRSLHTMSVIKVIIGYDGLPTESEKETCTSDKGEQMDASRRERHAHQRLHDSFWRLLSG